MSFSYDYSFNQIELVEWTNPSALISITVILLMIAAGVFYFLKRNLLAMGIALVISSLVLSSNLILPIAATAAERFLFSPSLGFVIIVGLLFNQLIQSPLGTKVHQLSWMALPIVLLFYSFQTYSRNSDWESNQTLFIKDVETSSNSYRAHHFAAAEYKEVGRKAANLADQQKAYNKSIYHLLESIKIYPDFMGNYEQLADLYKSKGDYPRGEKVALAGLKKDSGNIDLKLHLGDIYLQSKQLKNAQTTFAELIDVVDSTKAYFANYNLAAAYYNDRKFTEAIPYFEKAVQINPAAQDGLYFIGVSLYELEKYQDAIDKLILVTEANANYPWCVFTIGTSYLMLEKYTEAIPYLEKSLAYSPDEIGALAALAKAETEIGNIEKASDYYARIKKLRQ